MHIASRVDGRPIACIGYREPSDVKACTSASWYFIIKRKTGEKDHDSDAYALRPPIFPHFDYSV